MTTKLTSDNVGLIYDQCRAAPGDDTIRVKGIITETSFSKAAIVTCHDAIRQMLEGLPDAYRADSGGGWTFLNACYDRDGTQWTSFQVVMEKLFMLGMAANLVTELLPREMWGSLPGGMPYYAVTL